MALVETVEIKIRAGATAPAQTAEIVWDTMIRARRDEVVERRWLETGGDQPHGLSAFPLSPDRKASETVPILSEMQDSHHRSDSFNPLNAFRFRFAASQQVLRVLLQAAA